MSDNRRVSATTAPIIRPAVVDDAEPMARYHHRCSIEAFTPIVDGALFDQLDPRRRIGTFRAGSWTALTPSTSRSRAVP